MPAPSVIIKGVTTIIWGTNNTLGSPEGCIVESMKITPKNGAPIEIEDNNGFTAIQVLLVDGFDADCVVVYDTDKVWPAEGATVAMTKGKTGAAGGTESFNCLLGSMPQDFARKQEAKITLKLSYRPGVTLSA